MDIKAQAEEHPAAVGVLGVGLLAGLALVGYNVVAERRERQKPVNRLKRRASDMREDLGERLARTRERLPYGVYVMPNRSDEPADTHQGEPGMVKTLLWMGLTAGCVALCGLLARRMSAAIWQAVMHEPPPTSKV
jgi:hypothetical protein